MVITQNRQKKRVIGFCHAAAALIQVKTQRKVKAWLNDVMWEMRRMHANVVYFCCDEVEALGYFQLPNMR